MLIGRLARSACSRSWDTKAAYEASEAFAEQARAAGLAASAGRAQPFRRFEERVLDLTDKPPAPGCALGVTLTKMPVARIESNVTQFRTHVLPALRSATGYRGARNMIDPDTGEGAVGTYWDDDLCLERWMANSATRRSQATTRGVDIEFGESFNREVIYFHHA